jgi:serine/threonine protein phosphatase PrpC
MASEGKLYSIRSLPAEVYDEVYAKMDVDSVRFLLLSSVPSNL